MKKIVLSYILTTRNKYEFIQKVLAELFLNIKDDEEIIIIDGGSTDGTKEYLQKLFKAKKIDFFISEPDKGEAHALNKGLLLARGEIIKNLTDDDIFYYPGIQKCKQFMLKNPEIDILGTEGAGTEWTDADPYGATSYQTDYKKWQKTHRPFSFCGLGLMMRKSSLPLLGLFSTNFVRVDAEYTLRVTAGKATMGWYTGFCWVRVTNPKSNSITAARQLVLEGKKLDAVYLNQSGLKNSFDNLLFYQKLAFFEKAAFLKRQILSKIALTPKPAPSSFPNDWDTVFKDSKAWLAKKNKSVKGLFL